MTAIVTVASGKGGTGKTWFAASLAQALALAPGRRVLLVDADWGLANADVQLGTSAPAELPVAAPLEALVGCIRRVPGTGVDLLAAGSGSGRLADLAPRDRLALARKVAAIARAYDWTVIDLAAGADRSLRDWWRLGRHRMLVVTPDPGALTDAYAFLKLARADGDAGRAEVVVNRAPSRAVGDATAAKLERAVGHFLKVPLPARGVVLDDPRVTAAIRAQTPFLARYPGTATTLTLEHLARGLARAQKPSAQPSLRPSEPAT
ncbi:MAG: AAA family ATPase [Alphaproteobacteria bacterium]|jgi:flagellar biosynthesis protein FlhG|nr:AAA family ATPase [Alphaproteobacteria bacterium]